MRILMLGNSLTTANQMPRMLAGLTGAEVVCHTRGGARLSEHLNPAARLGARTQAALRQEHWDYVVLQEMSHGPFSSPARYRSSVQQLCRQIREAGAVPILYATWAYAENSAKLTAKGWDYGEMSRALSETFREAAAESHALIADAGQRFRELAGSLELYAADGVHPSEAGSRIAAETIASVIHKHKESTL